MLELWLGQEFQCLISVFSGCAVSSVPWGVPEQRCEVFVPVQGFSLCTPEPFSHQHCLNRVDFWFGIILQHKASVVLEERLTYKGLETKVKSRLIFPRFWRKKVIFLLFFPWMRVKTKLHQGEAVCFSLAQGRAGSC